MSHKPKMGQKHSKISLSKNPVTSSNHTFENKIFIYLFIYFWNLRPYSTYRLLKAEIQDVNQKKRKKEKKLSSQK
jgi:hypothetical protein